MRTRVSKPRLNIIEPLPLLKMKCCKFWASLSLTSHYLKAAHYDSLVSAHILGRIRFSGFKQRESEFEGNNYTLGDYRACLPAAAF